MIAEIGHYALVLALGLRSGLFELRYLVLSLPGLVLLAGQGIARLTRHPLPGVALGAFVTSVPQLLALRIFLGVGEAVVTPGSLRWIRFHVDEKQRGLAVGIFMSGTKYGPAIGTPWLCIGMARP